MATLSLQRSKELLQEQGYHVWITEIWHSFAHIRRDLFNMCDLVAIKDGQSGVLGVQACGEDVQSHVDKLLKGYTDSKGKVIEPNIYLPIWLRAGNDFFIWAWRKRGERGKRKTWQLRMIEFRITDGVVVPYEIPEVPSE